MPNRILRDWTDSHKFDGLSADAERLFVRLLMKADDYGRFHANPKLVKAACFPLSEDLRAHTVAAWLAELSDRHLVCCYTSGAGEYLSVIKFRQRLKQSRPRFPAPPGKPPEWLADTPEEDGGQPPLPGSSGKSAEASGDTPPASSDPAPASGKLRAYSETDSETDSETEAEAVCVPRAGASPEGPTHTPPAQGWEQAREDWGPERYAAQVKGLRPEFARLNDAAILSALQIEPDPRYRCRAWSEAMAALAGRIGPDDDPLRLVRAYLRNARRNLPAAGPPRQLKPITDDTIV